MTTRRVLGGLAVVAVVLAALAALAGARLGRWLDDNRDWIAGEATAQLGREVQFDDVGVSFAGGLAAELRGVRIADDPAFATDFFFQARALRARVRLWPLLQRRVEVASIVLDRPDVTLIRDENGFNVDSLMQSATKAPAKPDTPREPRGEKTEGGGMSALASAFLVSSTDMRGGSVRLIDRRPEATRDVTVDELGVKVSNVGLGRRLKVEMRARPLGDDALRVEASGVFGPVHRLDGEEPAPFELRMRLPASGVDTYAAGKLGLAWPLPFEADFTLEPVDLTKLATLVPAVQTAGASGTVAAAFHVLGPIDPRTVPAIEGALDLRDVALRPPESTWPITGLTTRVSVKGERIVMPPTAVRAGPVAAEVEATLVRSKEAGLLNLEQVVVRAFSGSVTTWGWLNARGAKPTFDLTTTVSGLDVPSMMETLAPKAPKGFRGRLDASVKVGGEIGDAARVRRSLHGGGRVDVRDGTLAGVNLVDGILGGVKGLPGLESLVPDNLRGKYPALFGTEDTRFEQLGSDIRFVAAQVQALNTAVVARDYEMRGAGTAGFDGSIDFKGTLAVAPPLTADLVRGVKEIAYATGPDGRLVIPFSVAGTWPDVRPRPDTRGLLKALGGGLLEKGLGALLGADDKKDGGKKKEPGGLIEKGLKGLFGR